MPRTPAFSRLRRRPLLRAGTLLLLIMLVVAPGLHGWSQAQPATRLAPAPRAPEGEGAALAGVAAPATALTVNPGDRADSVRFYRDQYLIASPPAYGWTGSVAGCAAGTTSAAFQAAVVQRINYFRAMAGVPADVVLDAAMSAKAQAAALIMSANGTLSHTPPAGWLCYTALGAQGAGSSNLALGVYGWDAIDLYMEDPGSGNYFVGHRRWVLHPPIQQMGTGDVPAGGGQWAANSLVVFGGARASSAPAVRELEGFVAWPPRGYVPYTVVYPRWSFSYPGADFSAATVTMRNGSGRMVDLTQRPVVDGFGQNTLVWEPSSASSGFDGSRPAADLPFDITVHNVGIGGQPLSFSYRVTIIDINLPPVGLAFAAAPLVENAPAGTAAGTLSASAPNRAGAISYTLVAGPGDTDNARFNLDGATLRTNGPLDFEQQAIYSVRVQASDGRSGWTSSLALTLVVQNANDPPAIDEEPLYVPVDEPFSATLTVTDQDGDPLTLSAEGLPGWLTFQDHGDGTAAIQGTASGAQRGVGSFTLRARDTGGAETSSAITILVGTVRVYLPQVSEP